jgi:hypothetical protein
MDLSLENADIGNYLVRAGARLSGLQTHEPPSQTLQQTAAARLVSRS